MTAAIGRIRVDERRVLLKKPWFTLMEKTVRAIDPRPFYSLKLTDYTTLFATTRGGDVLLVRQYRPAVERDVLELPSGTVDRGESPLQAAKRELAEETGYRAGRTYFLGKIHTDTGRLENRLWCYFTPDASPAPGAYIKEKGMRVVRMKRDAFNARLKRGRFDHALNLAVIMLAVSRGLYKVTT